MKIKFLSIIASFFLLSVTMTSCLGDDSEIEYSADATIQAFEIDTIYGIKYPFTIDQVRGKIYNEDSLPVHADTIIDKILVTKILTASGIVTVKNKDNMDSILFINGTQLVDSIDLRKPLQVKVYAPNYMQTKTYTIEVRIHKYDPDSLKWNYQGELSPDMTDKQKSVILNTEILTYSVINNELKVFRKSLKNSQVWTSAAVNAPFFQQELPTSIINAGGCLLATSTANDGKVYESADGINWVECQNFAGNHVTLLLAPLASSDKIAYIKELNENGNINKYFDLCELKNTQTDLNTQPLQRVPDNFPVSDISYAHYSTATGQEGIILVGTTKDETLVGDNVRCVIPWGFMGNIWAPFTPNNTTTHCPEIDHPSILYYNDKFYIFGDKFEQIYTSPSGLTWKKANRKFAFPQFDWKSPGSMVKPSIYDPEFRGRKNYSAVYDPNEEYIYLMFSKADLVKTADEHTYSHSSEAWRGRLNQLWFDLANNN